MAAGSKTGTFRFDQFKLDVGSLMLYRDGEELSVAPKIVKTLAALVENPGTIITKEELIERVWDDSIVEESNLTQYLYILRKTLGNMPDGRPYIETLRRRGYRFNGGVEAVNEERPASPPKAQIARQAEPSPSFGAVERDGNVLRVVDWQPSERPSEESSPAAQLAAAEPPERRRSIFPLLALAAAGLIVVATGGIFLWPRLMPAAAPAEPLREISVVRLTNGLMPSAATVSADGNVFAYDEIDGEIARLYVQQTGQASRIEIASSTDNLYGGKTFSPDGQAIFYVGIDKKTSRSSLYRIPTMGGGSVKILDEVYGPVSFSPDGKEIVFGRRVPATNETALVIAGQDGRAERVLLHRKSPTVVTSPAWSPDGKTIAYGEIAASGATESYSLQTVQVQTGRVTPYSSEKWDNILRIVWSPDGAGVVLIGTRVNEGYTTLRDQVYFVSYPEGKSHRVTTEGSRHEPNSLGVTKKGEIVTVVANRSAQIWSLNADGDTKSAEQLTKGAADGRAGLGPLPDGRLGYLARTAEEISLMVASSDRSSTKQFATGFQFIEELRADPLGQFFIFSAMKDDRNHIFRIEVDGGAVKQLTFGDSREIDSTVSPDGKYLVFDSATYENGVQVYALKRIPTEGGDPVVLKSKGCFLPTYSPDGSMISCVATEKPGIVIISAADGTELEWHPLPAFATWNFGIGWTPDGSGLIYIVLEKGISNLWIQPRDGGKPRALTNFSSGIIYRYAFSRDGSKLLLARGYPIQDAILIRNYR